MNQKWTTVEYLGDCAALEIDRKKIPELIKVIFYAKTQALFPDGINVS
jgi:hypothetical protein